MTLAPGTTLGPYRIDAPLGAGGMGEVYRATDPRVPRTVAIKVLPAVMGDDPSRRARFEREARAIGSLNHPNICTLFDVGEHEGHSFLVMELVEGETLAKRIVKGKLPVDEALRYAIEIAGALDRAHRAGIVHRDLKPANVMITKAGVKLLDFGLAKFRTDSASHVSTLATRPADVTAEGTVLGTLQYMSPEQLEGHEADTRSDIFAFGAVLYEMVTGRKAFEGKSQASLIGAILRDQPPAIATIQPLAPVTFDRIVRTCLEKDPDDRWQSAADLGRELRWVAEESKRSASGVVPQPPAEATALRRAHRRERALWLAAMLLTGASIGGLMWWRLKLVAPAGTTGPIYFDLALPDGDQFPPGDALPLAVSPDGTKLAYVALRSGVRQLFLRALSDPDPLPRALTGTESASTPFFDPTGQWIGFLANGKLKKTPVSGAGVLPLCDCGAFGASWGADGFVYLGGNSGIHRVSESGGKAAAVTELDTNRGETSHRWPHVLSDGVVLYTAVRGAGDDFVDIVRQSLSSGERDVLVPGGHTARSLSGGYLVYAHRGDLLATPWHPTEHSLGAVVPPLLREHPLFGAIAGAVSAYATSDGGTLAYLEGGADWLAHHLVWVDRKGNVEPLPQPEGNYQDLEISPDGKRAVVQIGGSPETLSIYDFARNSLTPFATGGEGSQSPVWTANGQYVIYRASRSGTRYIYWRRADGTGVEEPLTQMEGAPTSMTEDGRLVFSGDRGIYSMRPDGDRNPQLIVPRGTAGRVSPDGKWLAYSSGLARRTEVYVQAFASNAPFTRVSSDGGHDPRWSRDGRELFFRINNDLMVADVTYSPFAVGKPRMLYQGRFRKEGGTNHLYDVAADGRFLRPQPVHPDPPRNVIRVVLNWPDEVRKTVGTQAPGPNR